MENTFELLAPAGDMEKLKTAIHFGADAVYFAGKKFGLRAFASNFENIAEPVSYAHSFGKKAYVTVNIYPRNNDLGELEEIGGGLTVSNTPLKDLGKLKRINGYAGIDDKLLPFVEQLEYVENRDFLLERLQKLKSAQG